MGSQNSPCRVSREQLLRLWFHRQGLSRPREGKLTGKAFVQHLERTGGLQLDSVNAVDRAHYLTLWSRFGTYDRALVDRWVYRDRLAYEYRGHEATVLPMAHLPLSRRGMRRFRLGGSWWQERMPSRASFRRVLRRIREEGPLESADFEKTGGKDWMEDRLALVILWFQGRLTVADRRSFRKVYDLPERVLPEGPPASLQEYEDGWLLTGLSGNGIAPERHLHNYWTAPRLRAGDRRRVLARNLGKGRIVEVEVDGMPLFALPSDLEGIGRLPGPRGTTLLCPFDSFLWQRDRAEELLGFRFRVEIYVPPPRRKYGYYVLPILHEGELVGRLDPKLDREREVLQIRSIHLEAGFRRDERFGRGLLAALEDLAAFLGASDLSLPRGFRRLPA